MWLTEDPWPPMLILGVASLLAIAWWSSTKRAVGLLAAVGCMVLAGVMFIVEQAIVTPAEAVEQRVVDLCWAFQRRDPQTLEYFSKTSPQLRLLCQTALQMVEVQPDLRLTDFQTRLTNENSRAITHFRANATISVVGAGNVGRQPSRFELTWAREGDDWKVIQIRRLNPVNDKELGLLDQTSQ